VKKYYTIVSFGSINAKAAKALGLKEYWLANSCPAKVRYIANEMVGLGSCYKTKVVEADSLDAVRSCDISEVGAFDWRYI
jgi:hypothetical protein